MIDAIEMTGGTNCAPSRKPMTGMSKVAAPPAAAVLIAQATVPERNKIR